MALDYQFPYSKVIREDGEVIPASDHNKQEEQVECLTDAIGDYQFGQGTIENRISSLDGEISDIDDQFVTVNNSISALETDLDSLDSRVSTLESATDGLGLIASGAPGDPNESEVSNVNEIRFITDIDPGEQHFVTEISNGIAYIGGSSPANALSTLTGLTGLVTGRLSDEPSTTYPGGLGAGDSYSKITQNDNWTFDTDGNEFRNASLGNLILKINGTDVANIDLAANFEESNRSSGQNISNYNTQGTGDSIASGVVTFTGGTLSILSIAPVDVISTDLFQQGSARITLTSAALQQGYNTLELRHATTSTDTATLDWFYDTDPAGAGNDPTISSTDLTENTPVLKSLSGVDYYDTGSTFDLDITGDRLFNNVYHDSSSPITVSTSWDGNPIISITDPEVSGVSNPAAVGETMSVTGLALTVVSSVQDSDAQATSTPRDPYGTYSSLTTSSKNFVIMSTPANSTSIFESFVDERYRLLNTADFNSPISGSGSGSSWMPSGTALWDSSISIIGLGELQVYDHTVVSAKNRLIYPTFDYSNSSNFQPQPNPDYSSIGPGTLTYYRVFRASDELSKSNGTITFPGVSESDLTAGLGLRIKVPSKTMWLDLATAFNGSTFPTNAVYPTGVDGEGCRINSGENNLDTNNKIEFSLGSLGTDMSSDFQLILEITYADSTVTEVIGTGAGVSINW